MKTMFLVISMFFVISFAFPAFSFPASATAFRADAQVANSLFGSSHRLVRTGVAGDVSIANMPSTVNNLQFCSHSGSFLFQNIIVQIYVTSQFQKVTIIPVRLSTVQSCVVYGTFQAHLPPGTYGMTLDWGLEAPAGCFVCFTGQSFLLPNFVVERGELTHAVIAASTGL